MVKGILVRFAVAMCAVVLLGAPSLASAASKTDLLKQKINSYRTAQGLTPLKTSTSLTLVATKRAQEMFTYGYFTHGNAYCKTYGQLLAPYAFKMATSGENLALNTKTTDDTMRLWITSSEHHRNLLAAPFTHVGIAIVSGNFNSKRTTITVAIFGKKI